MTETGRSGLKPGVSSHGTRIMLARACGAASGSVTTIAIATAAPLRPEVNHLRPLMTHSSPSSSAVVARPVGSEPGGVGLGHREAAADLAVEQRLQPALLLLRGAVLGEDLGVAGVGRRAVEDERGNRAAAHLLAEQAVLPVGQAGPVLLVGQEEVPEALGLRLLPDLDHRRAGRPRPDRSRWSNASMSSRSFGSTCSAMNALMRSRSCSTWGVSVKSTAGGNL